MPRSDRLFRLPASVTAARLAEETGVSARSVYRDIASLRENGAEIEALVLGLAEVRQLGDPALAEAAASVR